MTPGLVFFLGIVLLVLFGWYFATELDLRKRVLGSVLTILVVALCMDSLLPLGELRRSPGLELKDPDKFVIGLKAEQGKKVDKLLQAKAVVALRSRLLEVGASDPVVTAAKEVSNLRVELAGTKRKRVEEIQTELLKNPVLEVVVRSQSIRLGLDLEGGTEFLIQLVPEEGKQIEQLVVDKAVEVIRSRVDRLGVAEPVITPAGEDRIMVQMPGLDINRITETREQLQRVAKLEFKLVFPQSAERVAAIKAGQEIIPPGYELREMVETREGKEEIEELLVKRRADLDGERVEWAGARYGPQGWEIHLKFDGSGKDIFGSLTKVNVGNRLAIVLDGKIHSAPVIRDAIYGGEAQITGQFSELEARNLASVLENPLAVPVRILQQRSVSATLGEDSVRGGVQAGLAGLALTLVFMLIYYRLPGIVANVAVLINMLILFGAMAMFGYTLTLPGIAGIILTLGMAVDANVLIYERLRDELAAGKSLRTAVDAAYDKAFSAIFDSNITTLITALILFWQAVGAVRGFAVTLIVGITASMFTALLVTRNLFHWSLALGWVKKLAMLNLLPKRKFNILGMRRWTMVFSLVCCLVSVAWLWGRGSKNLGVDFAGGDILMLDAERMVSEAQARQALGAAGMGDAVIQLSRTADKTYLSVRTSSGKGIEAERVLGESFPEAGFKEGQMDTVGPTIGWEFLVKSMWALLLGMGAILVYLTFRFEFSFALGAIVALGHDLVVTAGVYSMAGREMSLIFVGAVLTIAGYSINDSIVIFDRMREGLLGTSRDPVEKIMNDSINDTLSRTVITGGTTLFALLAIYFYGGPVLSDFAFTMLVGVIFGTYSSIFVAAPLVLYWSRIRGHSLRREVRESQDGAVKI